MSRENVEVVRRLYEAAASRDRSALLAIYDTEVEWDGSRSRWAEVLSGAPTWRGHDQLQTFFRAYYEMWENLEDDLLELIDVGDHVISVVTTRGRGRSSGVEVEWEGQAGLWTIRDGKVVRVVWFPSREEALEAVELRE